MLSHPIIRVFAVLLFCMLAACNKIKTQQKMTNLKESLTSYEVALRWAEHDAAYSYHVAPDGSRPPADLEKLNEISVTGIEITDKTVNELQTEAYTSIKIKYYNKSQGTIKTIKQEQVWWYNEINKQWFIKTEFPQF